MVEKKTTKKSSVKKKESEESKEPISKKKTEKYYYGLGRRKTAVARVRLYKGKGEFLINDKEAKQYFPTLELQTIIEGPLKLTNLLGQFRVSVKVRGGGPKSQAEAVRLGIARALVVFDKDLKKELKTAGFLKRDPRMKERKKPGLKKARRAPQWRKR